MRVVNAYIHDANPLHRVIGSLEYGLYTLLAVGIAFQTAHLEEYQHAGKTYRHRVGYGLRHPYARNAIGRV